MDRPADSSQDSMTALLHDLLLKSAERNPGKTAVIHKQTKLNYADLAQLVVQLAHSFLSLGMQRQDRIAIYLPKRPEGVAAMFAATASGGAFVPVNPLLKGPQVVHILRDCNVRILITSVDRVSQLRDELSHCKDLRHIIVLDAETDAESSLGHINVLTWNSALGTADELVAGRIIDQDMASIFYTSGSTGKPKGVVLSHRNMVAGAKSVAEYLGSSTDDRLLAVLPFSFDYGFSQLSTAFHSGASVTLMDYLFPKDVIRAVADGAITGLAGVPPLWIQIAKLEWPAEATASLR